MLGTKFRVKLYHSPMGDVTFKVSRLRANILLFIGSCKFGSFAKMKAVTFVPSGVPIKKMLT